ncbi:MAG: sugar phosphate isomerase/epimerase [Spirochaetales bacterium]|nr:sugar phosphate isomerase/epimerase [Spirochaetales bacterium]
MRARLGTNNFFAVKRWPEPEVWVDIVKNRLGLEMVQFNLDLLDPLTPQPTRDLLAARILKAAREAGLLIQSTYSGGISYQQSLLLHPDEGMRAAALGWFENAMEISGALEVEATGAIFGSMSSADFANPKRREYLTEALFESICRLSATAKAQGLRYFLWEASQVPKEVPARVDEVLKFHEIINDRAALPVHFLIDLGHTCNQEVTGRELDPYYWVERLGKICPMIHLQQTDGKFDRHWPFTREHNANGIIKAERLFEALDAAGVQEVFLVLETVHPFETRDSQVLDELEESADYWKAAIEKLL